MAEVGGARFTNTDALMILANFVTATREARDDGVSAVLVLPSKDPEEIALIVCAATHVIATMADVHGMSADEVHAMFTAAIYVERMRT